MVVTITAPGGATPLVLGDETRAHFISEYLPEQSRNFEQIEGTRADYQDVADRGNRINHISITVDRTWPTVEDALAHLLTHAESVPNQGLVLFSQRTGNGILQRWLADAVISQVRAMPGTSGVRTLFSYTFVGGEFLTSPNA